MLTFEVVLKRNSVVGQQVQRSCRITMLPSVDSAHVHGLCAALLPLLPHTNHPSRRAFHLSTQSSSSVDHTAGPHISLILTASTCTTSHTAGFGCRYIAHCKERCGKRT